MGNESTYTIEGLDNVQINIGKIVGAGKGKDTTELSGPTPKPEIRHLRDWDFKLLERYPPSYAPQCDMCCMCTFGKCDLTGNKEGACGIDLETHQARQVLQTSVIGTACHSAHGRHLLHHLIEKFGEDHPIDVGPSDLKTPLIELITSKRPETIGDLLEPLEYVEEQITQLLATTHTGQEGASIDFESKALHAGMLDLLGMEISDVAQISCLGFPKSEQDTPYADIGMGIIDSTKPVIVAIGHNVAGVTGILDYLEDHDMMDEVEIAGLCCTAHDMTRYNKRAKIIGAISKELKYIRSGIPDVIVVDEQCVRADVLKEASKLNIPVFTTNEKIMYGLKDRSDDPVDEIIEDLSTFKEQGVLMLDYDKLGEIVVKTALKVAPVRKEKGFTAIPTDEEFKTLTAACVMCKECVKACPQNLDIDKAMEAATNGDLTAFELLHDLCIGCGRCDQVCPKDIPVLNVIEKASQKVIREEKGKVRIGRGQVSDPEIREEGRNLVLGVTPGVLAFVGCPNYPDGTKSMYTIAEEMLKRNYIVVMSGCTAMDLGMYKNDEGKTLYEQYPGRFIKGNLLNVGSCVANSHIAGVVVKVAAIFAGITPGGNFEEIADYALNRIGACGLAWGAYSQKALAIGTGCNRLGVPVIVGPHGSKYRRAYIGKPYDTDAWDVYDARNGSKVNIEPAPEHLMTAAESMEEVLPMLAKHCIRPSDNSMGRSIKLTHYIELSQKYLGIIPDDWFKFVRSEADLPLAKKDELLKILEKEHGWEIDWNKKKIVSGPERKVDVSWQPTNVERLCKVKVEE
ncbi:MAG: CO dehydrogenase/acetyl-CoA synthase complex subunit epsilon [Methanosarcinales archaeon]|nr:CO dehydrogenase/acetyl-CoA synthase complex subunit epsilon [Methanosarcinales archaeon]